MDKWKYIRTEETIVGMNYETGELNKFKVFCCPKCGAEVTEWALNNTEINYCRRCGNRNYKPDFLQQTDTEEKPLKKIMCRIIATSGIDAYPTICGLHSFNSLGEAIEFAYYGAKGLNQDLREVVVTFDFDKRFYPDADAIVEIYDTYRE